MPETETRKFASDQAERRLGRLALQTQSDAESPDAEAVHDLRVALRRFSQVLRIFKACFRGKEARKIRREVKQMMGLAGEVRNCDIALKLMAKAERRATTGFPPKIENHRQEGERALIAFLKHWVERKSSKKWRGVITSTTTSNDEAFAKATIAKTAQRMLPRMAEQFFKRGNEAAKTKASPRELHQFRISSKKFRYTLELFPSLYGPPLDTLLQEIRRGQRLLGDINDCETVIDMLSQYRSADALRSWLKKRQRRKMEQFQRYWTETFAAGIESRKWNTLLTRTAGTSLRQTRKPPARATVVSRAVSGPPIAVA
jgi:CHAD domain-containing protein